MLLVKRSLTDFGRKILDHAHAFTPLLSSPQPRFKGHEHSQQYRVSIPLFPRTPLPLFASLLPMQPTSSRPSFWLVVSIATGLPLALWIYKVGTMTSHATLVLALILGLVITVLHACRVSAQDHIYG
jgi:hypothetical protein